MNSGSLALDHCLTLGTSSATNLFQRERRHHTNKHHTKSVIRLCHEDRSHGKFLNNPGKTKQQEVGQILVNRLARNLADRHLLKTQQRVLVAVSGGQDSICLLWMLSQLQPQWEWNLGIVHCDHQWSPNSSSQASHVAQVARAMGLDFYQAVATRDASGETKARAWRYGVFHRIATRHSYDAIITAHTASDRVETLLHNLFRGSGLQGLQALSWKRDFTFEFQSVVEPPCFIHEHVCIKKAAPHKQVMLVRPLLDTTRTELRDLCQNLELPLWPDPSNFSLEINRNRIRHELLPYLRKNFQGGIDRSLARWAEILHGEQSYLDSVCESIRAKAEKPYCSANKKEHGVKLNISVVETLPLALQRRILKQFIESHTGKCASFDQIEGLRLAYGQTNNKKKCQNISLRGGFQLHIRGKEMLLLKRDVSKTCRD